SDIAVRNFQLRIFCIELQRMTCLTISGKADALVVAAVGSRFMTIIAIEFLSVYGRNIAGKMTLMIEPKRIRIADFLAIELKFRVTLPECGKCLGVTALRPRQFQRHLLRRMRMSLKVCQLQLHSLLG